MEKKDRIKKYFIDRHTRPHYSNSKLSKIGVDEVIRQDGSVGKYNHTAYFPRSEQRYMLVKQELSKYLGDSVLDVGSRDKTLEKLIGRSVALIDKNNPDLVSFNWEKEKLPFGDSTYDTVVCLDTLEHIDNFHEGFEDLLRVSRNYVILSLPNPWKKTLNAFFRGDDWEAAYGLPPEKPKDRHKWFFNTLDVERFLLYRAAVEGFNIKRLIFHAPKTILRLKILLPIFKLILPKRYFDNLFVETVFIVIEKN